MKRLLLTLLAFFIPAVPGSLSEQTDTWTWYFHAVELPRDNAGTVDLILGIRTASSAKTGRLGNFNLRGDHSEGVFGLGSEHPPELWALTGSFTTRLSRPPDGNGWQLNAVYTGNFEQGPEFSKPGRALFRLRFAIRDTALTSGFTFRALDQTYWDDNLTKVQTAFDSAGGDIRMWVTGDTTDTTGVDQVRLPTRFALFQNFPNPFNPVTEIRYELPLESPVHLRILNSAGQTVRTFDIGRQFAGRYAVIWDGRDESGRQLTSGLYLLHFRAGHFQQVRKMLLTK